MTSSRRESDEGWSGRMWEEGGGDRQFRRHGPG